MELAQVRYFITLCRTLNFTRAADECGVTQPAFTRSIQRLEDDLGGSLIFRERSRTQLTGLGRAMRPHLEAMLNAADAARMLADSKQRNAPATLKIGLGPGIGAKCIADAVREIVTMIPDLSIHFEEASPAVLVEAMLTDRLDCALVSSQCNLPERLSRWPIYTDRAVAVFPAGHKLLAKNIITGCDIMNEPILVGECCGDFATELAAISPESLQLRRCTGATSHVLDLIGTGLGVGLLSDCLNFAPSLRTRPFHEPELNRHILLTVVAGRPLSPAAASFVKLCRGRDFAQMPTAADSGVTLSNRRTAPSAFQAAKTQFEQIGARKSRGLPAPQLL